MALVFVCSCSSIKFSATAQSYPEFVFGQYNFCSESEVEKSNKNQIALYTHNVGTWPFGIEYNSLDFLIDKNIHWSRLDIKKFSIVFEGKEIVLIKNKIIKNRDRLYTHIKEFSTSEIRNEKKCQAELVYRFDDSEYKTEFFDVVAWN